MIKIYKLLFISTLLISTIIAISSYSWMGMWMGLEMNMLSIIPLMNNKMNLLTSESSIKYFLVQALASTTLMFSIISLSMMSNSIILIMFNSSLLMKMGAAPFHFWFPEVMEGLDWFNGLILMTLQKITPMMLIINYKSIFISIIIIFSMFISGFMGLIQTSMRKIMAYSSINHLGWMLATLMFMKSLWIMYFTVYCIISMNMIFMFNKFKIFYMKHIFSFSKSPLIKLFLMMNFMSLGGLPPFLGFFPKWKVIQMLINNNFLLLSLFMILLTLLTLFIYMRIILPSIMFNTSFLSWKINSMTPMYKMMLFNFISINSLIISTLMINIT